MSIELKHISKGNPEIGKAIIVLSQGPMGGLSISTMITYEALVDLDEFKNPDPDDPDKWKYLYWAYIPEDFLRKLISAEMMYNPTHVKFLSTLDEENK